MNYLRYTNASVHTTLKQMLHYSKVAVLTSQVQWVLPICIFLLQATHNHTIYCNNAYDGYQHLCAVLC